jgi:hypothetical protein
MKGFGAIFYMTLVMLVFSFCLPFIVLHCLVTKGAAEAFGDEARLDLRRVYGEYFSLFRRR